MENDPEFYEYIDDLLQWDGESDSFELILPWHILPSSPYDQYHPPYVSEELSDLRIKKSATVEFVSMVMWNILPNNTSHQGGVYEALDDAVVHLGMDDEAISNPDMPE